MIDTTVWSKPTPVKLSFSGCESSLLGRKGEVREVELDLSLSTISFAWPTIGVWWPGLVRDERWREICWWTRAGGRWAGLDWGQLSGPDHCNGSQSGLGAFCLWWGEVRWGRWGRRHRNNMTHMVTRGSSWPRVICCYSEIKYFIT